MDERRLLSIMSGQAKGPVPALARGLLAAAAPLYALGAAAKNAAYDRGWAKARDLGRPTVSVGNVTTGGTGKTPMVAWVVRQLAGAGHRPCVLLRGYRARNGLSDEAEELRQLVGEMAQVAPCPDRVAEAARQLAAHPEITCFVLDDGFQHRRAGRDLDLVLVDATCPWGHGWTLPRGLLRESRGGIKRADGVVVTRCDRVAAQEQARVEAQVEAVGGRRPLALARHGWDGFKVWRAGSEAVASAADLGRERVLVVCGIGNPAAFMAQARAAARVAGESVWGDHHAWRPEDIRKIQAEAGAQGASAVLTTEKDFVKWRPLLAQWRPELPVYRPQLAMQFAQGREALATLLASRIPLSSVASP